MSRYRKNQYEVTTGVCVKKLHEGEDSYYLTAFFEDTSTQEARASMDVYYEAEPYSQLLIIHLTADKEWYPGFMRAFVIGPPIPPVGNDKSQPRFMDGTQESEEQIPDLIGDEWKQ